MKTLEEIVWNGYLDGKFPMADSAEDNEFYLVEPENRAVIPIEDLHVSRSLRRALNKDEYSIRINTDFEQVIDLCAQKTQERKESWISMPIRNIFLRFHEMGHAHSVEYWQDDQLLGGLYGLSIGAVFCGESMFSRASNASKITLVHLCARLSHAGYKLLDAQFMNDHLKQFGTYEIPQGKYLELLTQYKAETPDFSCEGMSGQIILENFLKNP